MPETISALTLATHDMVRAVAFYQALGFVLKFGGPDAAFSSFQVGAAHLNLTRVARDIQWSWWGRVIFHVADVDETYRLACLNQLAPEFAPRDASWGERYFHIVDPDGHELSFARPL